MSRHVQVGFYPAGASVVGPDTGPLDHLAVIRTGIVHVLDRGIVVDELGPGDTVGQLALLSGLPPTQVAKAARCCTSCRTRGRSSRSRRCCGSPTAGRWMALHTRSPISSTQERIKLGLEAGLLSADEAAWVERAFLELGDAMTTAVLLLVLATRLEAERGRVRTRDLVELSRRGARAH